jgi:DnaJ domain
MYHPDKNDSPDATAKFQEIGSAYRTIVDHLEQPAPGPGWSGHSGGFYPYDPYRGNDGDFFMDLEFFLCVALHSSGLIRTRLKL